MVAKHVTYCVIGVLISAALFIVGIMEFKGLIPVENIRPIAPWLFTLSGMFGLIGFPIRLFNRWPVEIDEDSV